MTNLAILPGGMGRICLTSLPMPSAPIGDQVLVRMLHAPINPADLLAIDGRYAFDLADDTPLGAEGMGVVEAIGETVRDLQPGDLVLPLSRGNWCRYRILPSAQFVKLPEGVDPVQAAMLRINPPTARLLLAASAAAPGDVIVQNAAASVVATWVRKFAAMRDISVFDIVRLPSDALPDAIVDGDNLAERVKRIARGRPIRAALDCVAGTATERLAMCLAPGGRLILFGHLSGEPICVRSQLLTGGGLSISGFSLRPAEAAIGSEGLRAMFAELAAIHTADPPNLPVRAIVPLSRAEEAIDEARAGGRGRVLFDLAA